MHYCPVAHIFNCVRDDVLGRQEKAKTRTDKQQHAARQSRNSSSSTRQNSGKPDKRSEIIRGIVRDDLSPETTSVRTTGQTKLVAMGQHRGNDVFGPYRYQRVRAVAHIGLHSGTLEITGSKGTGLGNWPCFLFKIAGSVCRPEPLKGRFPQLCLGASPRRVLFAPGKIISLGKPTGWVNLDTAFSRAASTFIWSSSRDNFPAPARLLTSIPGRACTAHSRTQAIFATGVT